MTTVKKPLFETKSEGNDVKFVKFGAFDENNFKPSELKKAKENEETYKPVRLLAGDSVSGVIVEVLGSKFGDILLVADATTSNGIELDEVKIGITTDLKNKLAFKKKSVGDELTIEYLGKLASPKDPTRSLHKVNVT